MSEVARTSELPGADLPALSAWLDEHHPGLLEGELTGFLIPGGKSNLTYILTDARGHEVVLRRPPLGHVLATAHDMSREARVMRALAGTAVPVPEVLAENDTDEVLGAPFYLMTKAEGTALRTKEELVELGAERSAAIVEAMMTVLADLHSIDPASVGLADFGRADGFLARQVARWRKQFEASRSRDLPRETAVRGALAERPGAGCAGNRPRRLPARQHSSSTRPATATRSPPCSTGRCRRSATRSPTSPCSSSTPASAAPRSSARP